MKNKSNLVRYLTAALLAVGAMAQTHAQTDVLPGTLASLVPDSGGNFSWKSDDCDDLANICETGSDTGAGETYTLAAAIGNTTKSATTVSGLSTEFTVPSSDGSETVLDARVSGGVSWRGTLVVVDLTKTGFWQIPSLGAKAEAFIRVSLVDVTDPDKPYDVGNDAIEDFGCDLGRELSGKIPLPLVSDPIDLGFELGWCEEERSETFSFPAKVVTGRTYQLQLSTVCQATTGVPLTLLSFCTFDDIVQKDFDLSELITDEIDKIAIDDIKLPQESVDLGILGTLKFPPDELATIPVGDVLSVLSVVSEAILDAAIPNIDKGFVSWDYMNIAVAPNLSALVDNVKTNVITSLVASETAITEDVEAVGDQVEVVRTGVATSIELLNTPSGKRTAGPIDGYPDLCGEGECGWTK